jgi:hypothetical protein
LPYVQSFAQSGHIEDRSKRIKMLSNRTDKGNKVARRRFVRKLQVGNHHFEHWRILRKKTCNFCSTDRSALSISSHVPIMHAEFSSKLLRSSKQITMNTRLIFMLSSGNSFFVFRFVSSVRNFYRGRFIEHKTKSK